MTADGEAVPAVEAWTLDGVRVAVVVDLSVHELEAAVQAAWKLTGRAHCFLARSPDDQSQLLVTIAPKTTAERTDDLVRSFHEELLDQQVRLRLAKEFGGIQTLIVAQAFAEGDLLDEHRDEGDVSRDPHGAGTRR